MTFHSANELRHSQRAFKSDKETTMMRFAALFLLAASSMAMAQPQLPGAQPDITQQQTYTLHRSSSADSTGRNADFKTVAPGATVTVLDTDGPGVISHIWFTINDGESYHLKRIVLRMYWDGEATPSVETPIGDFFGLGLGTYHNWSSEMLSVGSVKALNSYFPMPYRHHARITVTNEGKQAIGSLYYNIDYRTESQPLPAATLYFHAQYRQAQPNHGWTDKWENNGTPLVNDKANLDGKDNYVWLDAKGHGQYVGVTMSVLQNQDMWWGEGDDMFFIDGAKLPSITGTGSEDYFLGAWDFGGKSFSYPLYGAPVVGEELAGGRSSVYRFHFDAPIPFTESIKATIEHGHANHRSDNFYSVAYWYQAEPHAQFPALPPVDERIPALQPVGGPGNAGSATGR
jgi:D-arabinan exo alpha-(1,3)/(1,5)-arabinofuranosidase (non-reducing end)